MKRIALPVLLLSSLLAATSVASAQQPAADATRLHATRAQLQAMLERFEKGAQAEGYSEQIRQIARDEADLIRRRLEEGDVQVGDQIALTVTGHSSLTATFMVSEGRVLLLPDVGAVPLQGLLRSELQAGIRDYLARYIIDPQVFVRSLIRVSVTGAVGAPGYIVVYSDVPLTDVLAQAGQPTATAQVDDIRILRGSEVIWEGTSLQDAIIEGRTVDHLNLRAGDRIEVPDAQASRSLLGRIASNLMYVIPVVIAVAGYVAR